MTKKARPEPQTMEEIKAEIVGLVGDIDEYVIPKEVTLSLLIRKITTWKNSIADATIDAKVALHTDDQRLLRAAQTRLKTAIKAIEFLEKEVDDIPQEGDEGELDEPTKESEL